MISIEFKVFVFFLLDLEEILERNYQGYEIRIAQGPEITIKPGKAKESRLPNKEEKKHV